MAKTMAITKARPVKRSGADQLRVIVQNMDATRESFNDEYTAAQLVTIYSMQLESEWDFYPDQWTARQVREALAGKPPRWNDDETPLYE